MVGQGRVGQGRVGAVCSTRWQAGQEAKFPRENKAILEGDTPAFRYISVFSFILWLYIRLMCLFSFYGFARRRNFRRRIRLSLRGVHLYQILYIRLVRLVSFQGFVRRRNSPGRIRLFWTGIHLYQILYIRLVRLVSFHECVGYTCIRLGQCA